MSLFFNFWRLFMTNKTYWVTCKLEKLTEAEADAMENAVRAAAFNANVKVDIKRITLSFDDSHQSQEKPII